MFLIFFLGYKYAIIVLMEKNNKRHRIIVRTSIISIVANILLVVMKATVGLMSNSIAIITDAVNNLSDALSGIVTIIGTKIAGRAADKNHPYGHGRAEYVAAFVVSAIVLYAGATALIESVQKIIEPSEPDYNVATIIVLVIGIVGKFALGFYVKMTGKRTHSVALTASGTDALNDGILSISVLVSAIITMIWGINLEAYVGIAVSLYIIKSGIGLVKESVDSIVGIRADRKMTHKIKKEISGYPKVEGVYDLILTDYGPDQYMGSVHIEVPDTMTVAEIDKLSRKITEQVMTKHGVIIHTVGVYSVNTKDQKIIDMKKTVHDIVFSHPHILQMHGFYVDDERMTMSFDIIIDFAEKNRMEVYKKICDEVHQRFPKYKLNVTLDVDISD